MSKRDDKGDGFWWEGNRSVPKGWSKGRAGKAPRDSRSSGRNPKGWWSTDSRRGPTRGTSSTGHDRRGGWFLGRGR